MICSWVHEEPDLYERVNGVLVEPTPDAVHKFDRAFVREGRLFAGWSPKHFRSVTLAANGGRVVVRRWLDVPLREVVENVGYWLNDLILEEVQLPPELSRADVRVPRTRPNRRRPGPGSPFPIARSTHLPGLLAGNHP